MILRRYVTGNKQLNQMQYLIARRQTALGHGSGPLGANHSFFLLMVRRRRLVVVAHSLEQRGMKHQLDSGRRNKR